MQPPDDDPEQDAPNDQPGGSFGPPLTVNPKIDYQRERLNEVMRRGGRGCLMPVLALASGLAAAGCLLIRV